MQFIEGSNAVRSKKTNHASILRMIYQYGPITRAEISKRLNLTLPTITTSVNKMIAKGVIKDQDEAFSASTYGRKTHALDIVPDAGLFAGIAVSGKNRSVCITDFRGNVLCSAKDNAILVDDYDENIRICCRLLTGLMSDHLLAWDQISGMTVAIPAFVNKEEGILENLPRYQWHNKPICKDIARLTGYSGPLYLETDACSRGTAAQMFMRTALNNAVHFFYCLIGSGITCPLLINSSDSYGSVVRTGWASHLLINKDGPLCSCGKRGCLESYIGDDSVISACSKQILAGKAPILRSLLSENLSLSIPTVLQAQKEGDPDVQTIIDTAIEKTGLFLANISNFSNPDVVLIEGKIFNSRQNQKALLKVIRSRLYGSGYPSTSFIFVESDGLRGAIGAAATAICHSFELFA